MLFFSDRAGYRSHGSWGAESDAYLMFFDLDAYDRFRMSKEERELLDEAEKEQKKQEKEAQEKNEKNNKNKKNDKNNKKTDEKKDEEVKPLQLDLDNCRDRIVRLTVNSSHLGDALLNPEGDVLYYQAAFEGGYDLWKHDLKEDKTQIVMKEVGDGALEADNDFKNLYILCP